jgi:hypothetical protein
MTTRYTTKLDTMATEDIKNEIAEGMKNYARRLYIEEFVIDLLGGLVPGTLFIIATLFCIVPAFHAVRAAISLREVKGFDAVLFKVATIAEKTPNAMWLVNFVIFILFAYVIGHLFYRHDVKQADKVSLKKVIKGYEKERKERKLAAPEESEKKRNFGCSDPAECRFPYPDYKAYLQYRGLSHLLPLCVWDATTDGSLVSKTYINLLKIRLRYHCPERCGTIIHNEAHVRLATSTWRVCLISVWLSIISLLPVAIAISIALYTNPLHLKNLQIFAWYLPNILPPFLVLVFSIFGKLEIEKFLHYQRLREIFYVLETAYTAFRDRRIILDPPFKEFYTVH